MFRPSSSIALMVIVTIVTVITLILSLFGFSNYRVNQEREWKQLNQDLAAESEQAAVSLALPIWNIDRPQIEKILESVMLNRMVYGLILELEDEHHTTILRDRDEKWRVRIPGHSIEQAGLLTNSNAIATGSQLLGHVTVYGSAKFIETNLRAFLYWTIASILLLDIILSLGLYFLLWYWVFQPLKKIESYAVALNHSGSATIGISGGRFYGELESLRSHLEQMVVQLNMRYLELQKETKQRKLTETALRESDNRFRQMAENIEEIFFLIDQPTEALLYLSPISISILGYSPDEIIPQWQDFKKFWNTEDMQRIGFYDHGAWYKKAFNEEFRWNRPDWKPANIPYDKAEEKYETLLQGISGGAKRIQNIVGSLKDFARLDAGEISEPILIEKVIEAAIGIVDHLIKKSTHHFKVEIGNNIPRIKGRFQKLEQVIINLITNACQSLESREKSISIHVCYSEDIKRVCLRVEDQGCGITANLLNKVTDPFFTTKRDMGGTGLGLSVTYGIIKEHQGAIEIQSIEHLGTKVEILLPIYPEKNKGNNYAP